MVRSFGISAVSLSSWTNECLSIMEEAVNESPLRIKIPLVMSDCDVGNRIVRKRNTLNTLNLTDVSFDDHHLIETSAVFQND